MSRFEWWCIRKTAYVLLMLFEAALEHDGWEVSNEEVY